MPSASTDVQADGTYDLLVTAGSCTVRVEDSSGQLGAGWYSTSGFRYDAASAGTVSTAAHNATGINVTLPLAIHISGTVTDQAAGTLGDIDVTLADLAGATVASTISDGTDGTWSFTVIPGSYRVSFSDPMGAFLPGWYKTGGYALTAGAATTLTITTTSRTGLVAAMLPYPHITGVLTGDGAPIAGAWVSVRDGSDSEVAGATTEADGSYSALVAPGTYWVRVDDPGTGHVGGWYGAGGYVHDATDALAVVVTTDDHTGVSLDLPLYPTITGTVTVTGGAPAVGITVTAATDWGAPVSSTTTADGTYALSVPPGTYTVSFEDPTGVRQGGWWSAAGLALASAGKDSIVVGLDGMPGIDAVLPSALHIRGSVTQAGGGAVAGVAVSACGSGDCWTATTAAGGTDTA